MKRCFLSLFIVVYCFLAQAQTNVSGSITTDATWDITGSPYVLTSSLTVEENVILTIDPGVVVHFPNDAYQFNIRGSLKAKAIEGDSIHFFGNNPSSSEYGGSLVFFPTSFDNELAYVKIERLGDTWNSYDSAIYIDSAEVSIKNSIITNTQTRYVRVTPRTPQLLTFENNAIPYVSVEGGVVEGDALWKLPDVSYALMGNLTIKENVSLSLEPGMDIWLTDDSQSIFINGSLKAIGTPTDTIRFFGSNSSSNEYGGSLVFSSGSTANELSYVKVERLGDTWNSYDSAIYIDSAEVSIKNSIITNTQTRHVRVTARTPQLLTFENNSIPYVTVKGGEIKGDALWKLPDVSYAIIGNLVVNENVTLSLEPGMDIWLTDDSHNIFINGSLKAIGTPTDTIRFFGSHISSSEYGGSLVFLSSSKDNELEYVKVERLGDTWNSYDSAIYIDSADVSIKNSVITNTQTRYVRVTTRTPQLLNFENNDIPVVHVNSGEIKGDATWVLPDVCYSLLGDLIVKEGVSLTLIPNMNIKVPDDSYDIFVNGTLKAIGEVNNPIRIYGSNPSASEFGGSIVFSQTSVDNELNYVELDRLGDLTWTSYRSAIYIDSAEVSIKNTAITNTQSNYVRVTPRTPQRLHFENNNIPRVNVHSGDLLASAVWAIPDSSYEIESNLSVLFGDTLTIQAGTEVHFSNAGRSILVYGTLLAQGSQTNKIRFWGSGPNNTNISGYGGTLYFDESSMGSRLSYVELEDMGAPLFATYPYGSIVSLSPSLAIQHCKFINCLEYGIYIDKNSPVIKENCFESLIGSATKYGVFATENAAASIDATNNYWGDENGPYNALTNTLGNQDIQVPDKVVAIPFNIECQSFIENDMGIVQLLAPSSACVLTDQETVTVQVVNSGALPQSNFQIGYSINGNTPVLETISSTLLSGDIYSHSFAIPVDLSEKMSYSFEYFVIPANDEITSNNQQSIEVTHYDEFEADISEDVSICEGEFTVLVASGGVAYLWNTGSISSNIFVQPTMDSTYSVTVVNDESCVDVKTVTVEVLETPAVPSIVASSNFLCPESTITLTTDATNIIWSTGETTPSITVGQEDVYTLTAVNDNGCTSIASQYISEVPTPALFTANGGFICEGSTETISVFTGSFNSSFLWSTGETTQTIAVTPVTTQNYAVTVTSQTCTFFDSLTVIVEPDLPVGGVSNMLPIDGSTNLGLPVNLSWTPAENAVAYQLYIGLQGAPLNLVGTFAQINLNYANLIYGNSYCWQVIPISCSGAPGEASPIQCFSLEALPDLVVENISTPSTTAFAGAEIVVEWQVKNIGLQTSPNSNRVDAVYLSTDNQYDNTDQFLGNVSSQDLLSPGQFTPEMMSINLPKCQVGDYYLIVRTDRWNNIQEAAENNNISVSSQVIEVQASPTADLSMLGTPTIDLAVFAQAGESYDLNFEIVNNGDKIAQAGFGVAIFLDTLSFYNPLSVTPLKIYTVTDPLDIGASTGPLSTEITIPDAIASNDYYIHFLIDFNDVVEECVNDGNNTASTTPFEVLEVPKPDFEVIAVQATTNAASNKEIVTIQYDIRNNEAPFSGYLIDRIYVNNSLDYLTPLQYTPFAGSENIANLETKTRTSQIKIPSEYTGWIYVFVKTNAVESISESNFLNNFSLFDSIQVLSPNLVPDEIVFPATAIAGQNINVSWKDRNIGEGDFLNTNFSDNIYLSVDENLDFSADLFLGKINGNATILSNASLTRNKNVSLPNDISPGEYYVIIHTNANSSAYENGLYGDNIKVSDTKISISEGPHPNLIALEIEANTTTANVGDTLEISFQVKNDENATAVAIGNWNDRVYICSCSSWDAGQAELIKTVSHSQVVEIGGTYVKNVNYILPYALPTGDYYFYIHTDSDQSIFETDENLSSNIRRSDQALELTGYSFEEVDLAIQNVEPPCEIIPGEFATVYFESKNVGTSSTVAGNWMDGIVLSEDNTWNPNEDTLVVAQWPRNNDLAVDQSYANLKTFTIPDTLTGSYYALLVTDLYQLNNETNFSNNAFVLPADNCNGAGGEDPVSFPAKADLVINITSAPSNAIAGQPITVQFTVKNESPDATALASWFDKAFLGTSMNTSSAISLASQATTVDSLAAGASYTAELELIIPIVASGNYLLLLKTDAGNSIFEEDENNNIASKTIFVGQAAPSDLLVKKVINPSLDTIATDATISWILKNEGTNAAEGLIYQSVYLSEDEVYDGADQLLGIASYFIELAPFQETEFSLTGRLENLKRQDYFVIVRTDLQNNIPELDEANNTSAGILPMFIEVPEIIIDAPPIVTDIALSLPVFYRMEVSAMEVGSTVRVSIDSEDLMAFNELYVAHEKVPTRTVYDFGFDMPFSPNQKIVIPELEEGTYYIMAYPVDGADLQEVELKAETVPFGIASIDTNEGGNTGQVTTKITGGKFVEDMDVWLENGSVMIEAKNIILVNSTTAYVSFDLEGASTGVYDVRGTRTNPITENALLEEGFTIVDGTIGNEVVPQGACTIDFGLGETVTLNLEEGLSSLDLEKLHPPVARPGQTVKITLRYTNNSNVDVPIPQRLIESQNNFPISLVENDFTADLQAVNLLFPFDAGNQALAIIPPGGQVIREVYAKALGDNGDIISIKILEL